MRQCHRDLAFSETMQEYTQEAMLISYTDWVCDIAWASNIGLSRSYVVTMSQVRLFSPSFAHFSLGC